jgi:hypothetical protein
MSALVSTSAPASPGPGLLAQTRAWEQRAFQAFSRADLGSGRAAILLALVFFAVRLPWLGSGYGAETDSYRVALTGLHLIRDGEYLPSRLPGYPVHEFLMAPLVNLGGSLATDSATALVSLVGVFLFARIARRVCEPSPGLLVVAFAFTPFLLVNSMATKDYMWALTFLLGAYLAGSDDRPALAGLLLGLGIGCRITTSLFALPLLFLFLDRRAWRSGLVFLAVTGVTAFLVFLPVTLEFGRGFFRYADSRLSPDIIVRSIGQYSIGAIGALATLLALALSWRNLLRLPSMARADVHVRVWLLSVALFTLAFLRLPIDPAYLIPIYPFGYLLLGRVVRPPLLAGVVALILLSGVVDLDISAMHNFNLVTFATTARPCHSCAELAHDLHARRLWVHYATELGAMPVPAHSVVLTGGVFPDFAEINWRRFHYAVIDYYRPSVSILSDDGSMEDGEGDVIYLASPDRAAILERLKADGYRLFKADPAGAGWDVHLTLLS